MKPLLSQYRKPEAHTVQWPGCPAALTPKRLTRRSLLGSWGAAGLGLASMAWPARRAWAQDGAAPRPAPDAAADRIHMADMHSHYGMFLPRLFGLDLKRHMQTTGVALLAWSATDDHRWIQSSNAGWRQARVPEPGELWASFQARIAGYQRLLDQWELPKALVSSDVDAAVTGQPRVVLATEGANFLEGDVSRVATAHSWGVRHLQLVHFIQSPLGDHQTAQPQHGGLTPLGARVVAECARLGVVVDLAHGTANMVDGVLDASPGVPVWSHSWISPQGGSWTEPSYIARSLSVASARAIARRGGAVGLWSVRVRFDPKYPAHSVAGYADEILRMCDLIGPRHVAFGTDMEGAGPGPLLSSYVDLREVADRLARSGMNDTDLRDVLIGNYARILKQAMNGART